MAPLYHSGTGLGLALHMVALRLGNALSVGILTLEQLMLVMDITPERLLTAIFSIAIQKT